MTASVTLTGHVCVLSSLEPLEVWKHEWYHVVTNCQGHVLSPSGLPKVAKNCQKKPKPPQRHVAKPGEAGRSVASSSYIFCESELTDVTAHRKNLRCRP